MVTKPSASRKDPLQVHTSLEFRRAKTPGIIVRHGGGGGFRYLEFALPDQQRSVRVEWNSDEYNSAKRANKGLPVRLIVDGGKPRNLTYRDGALFEKGRSKPFVDRKAAVIGERFVALGLATRGTTRMQRPTGTVDPFGWFSCMSDTAGTGAGLGAAVGVGVGLAGGGGGVAVAGGAGAAVGAAAGAAFGLGWCTVGGLLGVA